MSGVVLAAIAATAAANAGPSPTTEQVQRLGTAAVLQRMIDPQSAQVSWPYAPVSSTIKGLLTARTTGWAACGRVNAKNRMGGYSGETWALVMFNNGQVARVDIGDPIDGIDSATVSCDAWLKNGTLKPALPANAAELMARNTVTLEARGMDAAKQGAAQGGYGISYEATPYGVYVMAVAPGSRAEAAGLRAGTDIVAIDGRPTAAMTREQLAPIFASAPAGLTLKISGGPDVHLPPR